MLRLCLLCVTRCVGDFYTESSHGKDCAECDVDVIGVVLENLPLLCCLHSDNPLKESPILPSRKIPHSYSFSETYRHIYLPTYLPILTSPIRTTPPSTSSRKHIFRKEDNHHGGYLTSQPLSDDRVLIRRGRPACLQAPWPIPSVCISRSPLDHNLGFLALLKLDTWGPKARYH